MRFCRQRYHDNDSRVNHLRRAEIDPELRQSIRNVEKCDGGRLGGKIPAVRQILALGKRRATTERLQVGLELERVQEKTCAAHTGLEGNGYACLTAACWQREETDQREEESKSGGVDPLVRYQAKRLLPLASTVPYGRDSTRADGVFGP